MGMTDCWLCSALVTVGTWWGGLVLERHTLRGRGDTQGMGRGQGTPWGHARDTKKLRRTENKKDMGCTGNTIGGNKEHGGGTWTPGHTKMLGEDRGHSGERLEGTSDALGAHERGQGDREEYGDSDSGQEQ